MGGSGAKERRRLQRLSHSPEKDPPAPVRANDKSRKAPTTHNVRRKHPDEKRSTASQKKTKKFHKPKHLKRKLEQVLSSSTTEGDSVDDRKQEILFEIKQWEERKKANRVHPPSETKKLDLDKEDTVLPKPKPTRVSNHDIESTSNPKKSRISGDEKVSHVSDSNETRIDKTPGELSGSHPKTAENANLRRDGTSDESHKGKAPTNDSDSDESVHGEPALPKRQRGRRRRGRQDTSLACSSVNEVQPKSSTTSPSAGETTNDQVVTVEKKDEVNPPPDETMDSTDNSKKQRYCIGRKPVTDFVVGQTCEGTVVYVKPFGLFLDIGCHSDAFCHVSRLRDDYVESPEALFKSGDVVPNARVVEIDRSQKRITVSLQSTAMVQQENASIEQRKQRRERLQTRKRSKNSEEHGSRQSKEQLQKVSSPSSKGSHIRFDDDATQNESEEQETKKALVVPSKEPTWQTKPESEMNPAELKRSRKLARRAARRAAKEGNGGGTGETDDPEPSSQ